MKVDHMKLQDIRDQICSYISEGYDFVPDDCACEACHHGRHELAMHIMRLQGCTLDYLLTHTKE